MRIFLRFLYEDVIALVTYLAIAGAGFLGFMNGGIPGLIGGGLLAMFVCQLLGFAIRCVLVILFGPSIKEFAKENPNVWERAGSKVLHTVGLVCAVIVLHDVVAFTNMAVTTMNYNTGAQLTQSTVRGDSRAYLREQLKIHEWMLSAGEGAPTSWLLTEDIETMNRVNLQFIQQLRGKGGEPENQPTGLKESLQQSLKETVFKSENWLARKIVDRSLNAYGNALCEVCREEIAKQQQRGWILRHLPPKLFLQ